MSEKSAVTLSLDIKKKRATPGAARESTQACKAFSWWGVPHMPDAGYRKQSSEKADGRMLDVYEPAR